MRTPSMRQELGELLPRLRRFARSLAGDPADADDLVQTALERGLARASQWQPQQGGVAPWIFGILRNAWLDELRARRRRGEFLAPVDVVDVAGPAGVDAHDTGMSVAAAVRSLPPEQRAVVALVLVEGMSYREAAEALDIPVGTVTSRLGRARRDLQRMLGDEAE